MQLYQHRQSYQNRQNITSPPTSSASSPKRLERAKTHFALTQTFARAKASPCGCSGEDNENFSPYVTVLHVERLRRAPLPLSDGNKFELYGEIRRKMCAVVFWDGHDWR